VLFRRFFIETERRGGNFGYVPVVAGEICRTEIFMDLIVEKIENCWLHGIPSSFEAHTSFKFQSAAFGHHMLQL